ncbi:MAG: cytochrome c oxidase subunit [Actinomycetota bacterium]
MRRKLPLAGLVVLLALAAAGAAAAANGGFAPQNPHSPNAHRINDTYYLILGLTSGVFVLVVTLLAVFIWRYRSRGRPRTVEGVQVHGNTRLELMWTAAPVLILAAIVAFVFYKLPGISDTPAAAAGKRIDLTVEGHQFYWQYDYPNGARSIGDLHVPAGRTVYLKIVSADVDHSWWVPQLGGKTDAIPGRTNHTWFVAERPGTYLGPCAEFCGVYHEAMQTRVIATSPQEYATYVGSTAKSDLGRAEFTGVCATCHGMKGEGGYGPGLSSNPLLTQASGLAAIVRHGRGRMPPVGDTWTKAQMRALTTYVKTHVYKGAAGGG